MCVCYCIFCCLFLFRLINLCLVLSLKAAWLHLNCVLHVCIVFVWISLFFVDFRYILNQVFLVCFNWQNEHIRHIHSVSLFNSLFVAFSIILSYSHGFLYGLIWVQDNRKCIKPKLYCKKNGKKSVSYIRIANNNENPLTM